MLRPFLLLVFFVAALPVQAAMDLFSLRIPAPPGASQQALLKQALGIELIRLSGVGVLPGEAQTLLQTPERFVARTAYVPWQQDGVTLGQQLEVHFARAPLLKAMEQAGLEYWPLAMRPRVMVALVWSVQGQAQPVTPEIMQVRPDLNIEPLLYQLGIPHGVPSDVNHPLFHRPVLSTQLVKQYASGHDGVVRLYASDSLRDGPQRVALDWESLLPDWPDESKGHLKAPDTLDGVRQAFLALMARWRQQFDAVADVEGHATLRVLADDAESLLAFDRALPQAAPFIVEGTMTTVRKGEAGYDLVYRGSWQFLLRTLQHLVPARVEVNNPVKQEITLQLLSKQMDAKQKQVTQP
ncbi:hypothetical protein SAMN05443662_0882 [Sulfurivirga caldicuralii]|uniref:DUF2066 domain-containing protein n=1 Tax=Sulfurivirga caldicuralii TaxID=364032 RepID=A0A1N6F2A5_9GAMM|nr:DUF2066 domain-containing protein [Sulfurivirga caldicuralii]SIN89356.1 hypothetical protein SAMN05443662_0882 [Sulfurivirga caldicuralii]